LWHRRVVSLTVKDSVWSASTPPTLLYGCEICPLRASDSKQPEMFDHPCLRSVAHIGLSKRVSNEYVRELVFGNSDNLTLAALLNQQWSGWLGHLLRMPTARLSYQTLFVFPE
jgi:hypothetical protein